MNDSNSSTLTGLGAVASTALTTVSLGSLTVASTNVVQVECDVPGINGSNFAGVLRAGTVP